MPLLPKDRKGGAKPPSMIRKVTGYIQTQAKEVFVGMPMTPAQIQQRLAICQSCDQYDQQREVCKVCGCNCNGKRNHWLNKLATSSSVCPHPKGAKWEAISSGTT